MAGQMLYEPTFLLKVGNKGRLGGSAGWASDFGSGYGLVVRECEPHIGLFVISAEPASDPLSPSLSAPNPCCLPLSLSKITIL